VKRATLARSLGLFLERSRNLRSPRILQKTPSPRAAQPGPETTAPMVVLKDLCKTFHLPPCPTKKTKNFTRCAPSNLAPVSTALPIVPRDSSKTPSPRAAQPGPEATAPMVVPKDLCKTFHLPPCPTKKTKNFTRCAPSNLAPVSTALPIVRIYHGIRAKRRRPVRLNQSPKRRRQWWF
jgi:hypothetical protein